MNEQSRVNWSPTMQVEIDAVERATRNALAQRRTSGEILTYALDGWIVQEHPGGRIERLAPAEQFRAADHPYPGFELPPR